MSATEILIELPKLTRVERRAILNRLIELDDGAELLDERRRQADEMFRIFDAMEESPAKVQFSNRNGLTVIEPVPDVPIDPLRVRQLMEDGAF